MTDPILVAVLVVIILLVMLWSCREDFNGGPSLAEKRAMIDSAMVNAEVFSTRGGGFNAARARIPGIDNVTYEDFRKLHRTGRFNQASLSAALNGG